MEFNEESINEVQNDIEKYHELHGELTQVSSELDEIVCVIHNLVANDSSNLTEDAKVSFENLLFSQIGLEDNTSTKEQKKQAVNTAARVLVKKKLSLFEKLIGHLFTVTGKIGMLAEAAQTAAKASDLKEYLFPPLKASAMVIDGKLNPTVVKNGAWTILYTSSHATFGAYSLALSALRQITKEFDAALKDGKANIGNIKPSIGDNDYHLDYSLPSNLSLEHQVVKTDIGLTTIYYKVTKQSKHQVGSFESFSLSKDQVDYVLESAIHWVNEMDRIDAGFKTIVKDINTWLDSTLHKAGVNNDTALMWYLVRKLEDTYVGPGLHFLADTKACAHGYFNAAFANIHHAIKHSSSKG